MLSWVLPCCPTMSCQIKKSFRSSQGANRSAVRASLSLRQPTRHVPKKLRAHPAWNGAGSCCCAGLKCGGCCCTSYHNHRPHFIHVARSENECDDFAKARSNALLRACRNGDITRATRMLRANVRIEDQHITAAKLAGFEELVVLLERKGFNQYESKLMSAQPHPEGQSEAAFVATNVFATAKYRKTCDKRLRTWRNASFSGLCAQPFGFKLEGTNHSRECCSSIPMYVMDYVRSREAMFVAQFAGRYQGLLDVTDGKMTEESKGLQDVGMNVLRVANYLNFESLCAFRTLNHRIAYGVCDSASFASALYRARFLVCFSQDSH